MWKMMSIVDYNAQKTEQLTKKTWGQGWVVLVVSTIWQIHKEEEGGLLTVLLWKGRAY